MANTPRPVKGKFAVTSGGARVPHEEGFRHALDNALNESGWDPGDYANVRVEFSAAINVVNPGRIIEYSVTLTPPATD